MSCRCNTATQPPVFRPEKYLFFLLLGCAVFLAACSSGIKRDSTGSGDYRRDGPGDLARLDTVPDAVPRVEPIRTSGPNKPYTVMGRSYKPDLRERPFRQRGKASWYGKAFHGRQTSSGEVFDMYAMTAAHPTLPIPSYARVTHAATGQSVIVRINDRGPFIASRVIDLSYAAAWKLGYVNQGSAEVIVERILPADIHSGAWRKNASQSREMTQATVAPPPPPAPAPAESSLPPEPVPMATSAAPPPAGAETASLPAVPLPAATRSGLYLQLGAFRDHSGVDALARHLGSEMSWLADWLVVDESGGWYRLQAGPYATREAAGEAAGHVRNTLGLSPFITTRP